MTATFHTNLVFALFRPVALQASITIFKGYCQFSVDGQQVV